MKIKIDRKSPRHKAMTADGQARTPRLPSNVQVSPRKGHPTSGNKNMAHLNLNKVVIVGQQRVISPFQTYRPHDLPNSDLVSTSKEAETALMSSRKDGIQIELKHIDSGDSAQPEYLDSQPDVRLHTRESEKDSKYTTSYVPSIITAPVLKENLKRA